MKTQKKLSTKKMLVTALLAALAYVLNSFVYFPAMAPFQHFVDVLAAVLVGPWYGFASALICGILRMMSGRTIQAVTGAIFGPILGGLIYRKTHNLYLVFLGEVIGTGILGALTSYPLMKIFYGLDVHKWYYFVPYYTPAAIVGAGMGLAVTLIFQKTGLLKRMHASLD
ncbi:energy coupling factor transporter S component ThiW [Fructobacillus cardui]|uniref:energy coupling factor transporter S component ThiW n=1 Tax=Fructobacillus cardui TaxID=2893170 RepID=UPI002598F71E|nr:energy coupling factor transporter S component ThiW [uncultured Fructobacillus sp.]CAK1231837.1 ECF-type thiazole transporter [Fructobacillus cardui]